MISIQVIYKKILNFVTTKTECTACILACINTPHSHYIRCRRFQEVHPTVVGGDCNTLSDH